MTTISEKAKAYGMRQETMPMAETAERAYTAGAFEALASQWKDPNVVLPTDQECVVIYVNDNIETAMWNEYEDCWDDVEYPVARYNRDVVKAWMSVPPLPLKGGVA